MQEARSKFSVDVEPENAVVIDPSDGNLSPEGLASLHFKRMSPSASTGRISCKVCFSFGSYNSNLMEKSKLVNYYTPDGLPCFL